MFCYHCFVLKSPLEIHCTDGGVAGDVDATEDDPNLDLSGNCNGSNSTLFLDFLNF